MAAALYTTVAMVLDRSTARHTHRCNLVNVVGKEWSQAAKLHDCAAARRGAVADAFGLKLRTT